MGYERTLIASEVERHFIYINRDYRSMFPLPHEKFKLIVGGKKFDVCLDSYGRLWGAVFWKKLGKIKIGDKVVIVKKSDDTFILKKKGR